MPFLPEHDPPANHASCTIYTREPWRIPFTSSSPHVILDEPSPAAIIDPIPLPEATEEFLYKHDPDSSMKKNIPELSTTVSPRHTIREMEEWVKLLPPRIQNTLKDSTGKHNINHQWTTEIVFRHLLPALLMSGFLDPVSFGNLDIATPLVGTFLRIQRLYTDVDPSPVRGYAMYKQFRAEKDFHPERCRLSSAALFHCGFFVPSLVRWMGGPHTGAHRDLAQIRRNLTPSVDPELLNNVIQLFERGAPNACEGHSTNINFMEYFRYGNHASCEANEDLFKEVMVKDSKRGNTILVDPCMTLFIPNLHVTPQAIVDVENVWKSPRPVFDSTWRPNIASFAINDWIDKITEGEVFFPGSFQRFLISVYNLRISFPYDVIFLCDDDITNAFRLIKINPEVVSMHAFRGCGKLALSTGNTFGNTNCPFNFDQPATARTQHASYLWTHRSDECIEKEKEHLALLTTEEVDTTLDFTQAERDSLNPGVFDDNDNRLGAVYVGHVDDTIYASTKVDLERTVACSLVSATETFGGNHECQEKIISEIKLDMDYKERRVLLGYLPDSRTMMVGLSPRRRKKIIQYIEAEGWLLPKSASIRDIARILGLLQSICDIYLWGQAQLLVLQQLLGDCIRKGYNVARRDERLHRLYINETAKVPVTLSYRLRHLRMKMVCEFLWKSRRLVVISQPVRQQIILLFKFLVAGNPWQCPIGHLIPRIAACQSFGDASYHGIGVVNHSLKAIIVLPFTEHLHLRMNRKLVHINTMELIALFLAYIMFLAAYEEAPGTWPTHPVIRLWGDNMSANKWFRTFSTNSRTATRALLLFAEYMKDSPVSPCPEHIPGKINIEGDDLSRLYTLFTPPKKVIHDLTFDSLLRQVCLKYKNMLNYNVFLLNPELKSDLCSLVYSDSSTAVPKRRAHFGRFFPIKSIFSGSVNNTAYSSSFSL